LTCGLVRSNFAFAISSPKTVELTSSNYNRRIKTVESLL